MSTTIWRYDRPLDDNIGITTRRGAEVLHVAESDRIIGGVAIWLLLDTLESEDEKWFRVVGTGNPANGVGRHVGSYEAEPFVWHVFEED